MQEIATLRFSRSHGPHGFHREGRASTDALGLLWKWSHQSSGRSFEILEDTDRQRDEPDYLIAALHVATGTVVNVDELQELCNHFGLNGELEQSRTPANWESAWKAYKTADQAVKDAWAALVESDDSQMDLLETFEVLNARREGAWQAFVTAHRAQNSFSRK
jgi:hypothetical protein